jgi:hypothetical protein
MFQVSVVPIWCWIGVVYLCILTFQDYTKKMFVDDRYNFFMDGVTFMVIALSGLKIWYLLGVIVSLIVLDFFLIRFKVFGFADIHSLSWIFVGFAIIGFQYLLWFFVAFIPLLTLFVVFKTYVFKYNKPVPMYFIILISFVFIVALFRLIF